jgi:hypothetical protein
MHSLACALTIARLIAMGGILVYPVLLGILTKKVESIVARLPRVDSELALISKLSLGAQEKFVIHSCGQACAWLGPGCAPRTMLN